MDAKRDLKLSKALPQASRFLLRGVKIARLCKRNVSGRVTPLTGTELWLVSFN